MRHVFPFLPAAWRQEATFPKYWTLMEFLQVGGWVQGLTLNQSRKETVAR